MPNKTAVMETSKGTIELELFADEVPNTVANFEKLANSGFYDGTKFHRVIPNFMIQGGDPYSKTGKGPVGTGGPGYTIKCETHRNVHTPRGGHAVDGARRQGYGGEPVLHLSLAAMAPRRGAYGVRPGHQGAGGRQCHRGRTMKSRPPA